MRSFWETAPETTIRLTLAMLARRGCWHTRGAGILGLWAHLGCVASAPHPKSRTRSELGFSPIPFLQPVSARRTSYLGTSRTGWLCRRAQPTKKPGVWQMSRAGPSPPRVEGAYSPSAGDHASANKGCFGTPTASRGRGASRERRSQKREGTGLRCGRNRPPQYGRRCGVICRARSIRCSRARGLGEICTSRLFCARR
jgi:hypothetical protein